LSSYVEANRKPFCHAVHKKENKDLEQVKLGCHARAIAVFPEAS